MFKSTHIVPFAHAVCKEYASAFMTLQKLLPIYYYILLHATHMKRGSKTLMEQIHAIRIDVK